MPEERAQRRLAAMLAADVVGYSRLMEADEAGTLAALKQRRRDILQPLVAEHHGRIVKVMGDGVLIEFGSAVNAVQCAIKLQNGMTAANGDLPENRRIVLRIGVNLGDVMVEGGDLYGDGVNIVARLEGIAEPNAILVSGSAYDQVKNKIDAGFESLGTRNLKNIAEPVRVYRVRSSDQASALRPAQVVPDKPSIAVLPFRNMSDDPEQGYLADGITEDLTTELARVSGLFVVSRNAAFTYKGKAVPPAQIARELGVRYILEGSTRRAGEEMRINAQLIDAQSGGHLWAERFDSRWAEVFTLQDKVVENVASALKLRLVGSHRPGGTSNPAAYEAYLKGLTLRNRDSVEDFVKAAGYFHQAVAFDPDFGAAEASLANIYWDANEPRRKALNISTDERSAKLLQHLDAAAKHASTDYYGILTQLLVRQQKSDEAIDALERAIALDPSEPSNYWQMSQALTFNGRAVDGMGFLDAATRVNPGWTNWRRYLEGLAYFSMGRFVDAAASLEKLDLQSDDFWSKFYGLQVLLSAYGYVGGNADIAAVKDQLKPLLNEEGESGQELSGLLAQTFFAFRNRPDFERLLGGLLKAGVPEAPFGMDGAAKDRLTGAEIAAVFIGHEVEGRDPDNGECYWGTTAADGMAQIKLGTWSDTGSFRIEGDTACAYWSTGFRVCSIIFRNPTGIFGKRNEYILTTDTRRLEFSVVK